MLVKDTGVPVVGIWRVRLVKNGPFVPAKIWDEAERGEDGGLLEDEKLFCIIDGSYQEPENWAERLNLYGIPIDEAEFQHLSNVSAWAKEHAPDQPEAAPREAIDLNKMQVIF